MNISSSKFENNGNIPLRYTCDGENINPPLNIEDVPAGAKSLVLIMDDPDAPNGDWVHWLIWNISPETSEIEADSTPAVVVEGTNSGGKTGYSGPCPPSGVHRYFFKLYALNEKLNLEPETTKKELLEAINGHIIEQTQLVGLYSRKD